MILHDLIPRSPLLIKALLGVVLLIVKLAIVTINPVKRYFWGYPSAGRKCPVFCVVSGL